jgi:hypothetical protein
VKNLFPGTPSIPEGAFPETKVEFAKLKYWVSKFVHQSEPVDPGLDPIVILNYFSRLAFIGFSHGALSHMLFAETNPIEERAATNNRIKYPFIIWPSFLEIYMINS